MWARLVTGLSIILLSNAAVWSGEAIETGGTTSRTPSGISAPNDASEYVPIEPWIHSGMPESMGVRLKVGFDLALKSIQEIPECRALFSDLGADAIETLRTGLYFPIGSHRKEKAVCGRAVAYTNVGAAPTFLCRQFAKLSEERAAMYVIHEALHHAGLSERPHDQSGMTSRQINTMVTTACQL